MNARPAKELITLHGLTTVTLYLEYTRVIVPRCSSDELHRSYSGIIYM